MTESPITIDPEKWMDLPPHVQRMITEENELFDRLDKLEKFTHTPTFMNLTDDEQEDLIEQTGAMLIYLLVLRRRVAKARNKQ